MYGDQFGEFVCGYWVKQDDEHPRHVYIGVPLRAKITNPPSWHYSCALKFLFKIVTLEQESIALKLFLNP